MRKLTIASVLFLLTLFTGTTIFGQSTDTIAYTSEYEQEVFEQFIDSLSVEPLELLFALNYNKSKANYIDSEIKRLIQHFKSSGIESKKTKKQIQQVYDYVHDKKLRQYSLDANFNDIFNNGTYNCVGASALYALVFEELGIEYQIKEMPTHVYIIADPYGSQIMVESTLPSMGTYEINQKSRKEFINYLKENKIISESEFKSSTTDQLYNKYSQKDKDINLKELSALLYYNKGVALFNSENYIEAAQYLEKAYLIYPSNTIRYMYNISLKNEIVNEYSSKDYNASILVKYLNLNSDNEQAKAMVFDAYRNFSLEKGINNPDIEAYKTFYQILSNSLSEDLDLDEYSQTYYRILGYNEYVKNNYPEALNYLSLAYVSNPENLHTKELIVNATGRHIITNRKHEEAIDSMELYFDIFPFLIENNNFQQYYTFCMLHCALEYCTYDKFKTGLAFLDKFEHTLSQHGEFVYREDQLEHVYGNISVLYIEEEQYSKASKILLRGLVYEPSSLALNELLKSIREYQREIVNMNTEIETIPLSRSEQFKKDISNFLSQCWTIDEVRNANGVQVSSPEDIVIRIKEGKKVEFVLGAKTQHGKWAVRYTSRLLYLIPERNKDNYEMFKIETIDENNMELRSYEDRKMTKLRISMKTCPD